jgi:hypothetical protein
VQLVAKHGRPRWRQPLGRVHRLTVVVRVEHHGARRTGSAQLPKDHRWSARGRFEKAALDATLREQREEMLRVASNVDGVAREVPDREEVRQLADDLDVAGGAVCVNSRTEGLSGEVRRRNGERSEYADGWFHGVTKVQIPRLARDDKGKSLVALGMTRHETGHFVPEADSRGRLQSSNRSHK